MQDQTLFISILGFLNVQPAVDILKWFERIIVIHDFNPERFIDFTTEKLRTDISRLVLTNMIKEAGIGFESMLEDKISQAEKSGDISSDFVEFMLQNELLPKSRYNIKTIHKIFDTAGNEAGSVTFDLRTQESEGKKNSLE